MLDLTFLSLVPDPQGDTCAKMKASAVPQLWMFS